MQLNLLPDTYNNGEVEEGKHCENLLAVVGVGAVVCCGSKGSVDRTGQTNPSHKNSIRSNLCPLFVHLDPRWRTRGDKEELVRIREPRSHNIHSSLNALIGYWLGHII